jgi:hypothetical protein
MLIAVNGTSSSSSQIREDLSACVADLGISRIVGPRMTKAMGTPRYMVLLASAAPFFCAHVPHGLTCRVVRSCRVFVLSRHRK